MKREESLDGVSASVSSIDTVLVAALDRTIDDKVTVRTLPIQQLVKVPHQQIVNCWLAKMAKQ
jgi:hypothetical protein